MTIFDYIFMHAQKSPERMALKSEKNSITYGRLQIQINTYGEYLQRNICHQGDRVILRIKERQDWFITFLSLLAIGCLVIPVPPDITDYELETVKADTKADAVVDQYIHVEPSEKAFPSKSNTGGIIHMTSGTTGKQKYCVRNIMQLTIEGEMYQKTFQLDESDKILALPPLYHSYALGAGGMSALVTGACLYTLDTFVPRRALSVIQEEKITILIMVPVMAKLLCNSYTASEEQLKSVRLSIVGAGAISKELYEDFYQKYGITLLSNYGSTETGAIISRVDKGPYNSVGKPMEGVMIKVLDENKRPVPIGEQGKLWVKCPNMFTGYLGMTKRPKDEEGWFPMHDIVYMNQSGALFICGRECGIINIGGKKVNPKEVEDVILSIPKVKDCVVMECKDKVKAFVAAEGLTPEAIRKECMIKLSNYKVPSMIEFIQNIPRNELGKVQYRILTDGVKNGC